MTGIGAIGIVAVLAGSRSSTEVVREAAQRSMALASPGALSAAHARWADDCNVCHTPVVGVDTVKCVLCHANSEPLLQRQPTAFHASINTCKECHREHRGQGAQLSLMDHSALAELGARRLERAPGGSDDLLAYQVLRDRLRVGIAPHPRVSALESQLDCSRCHANDDPHRALFGSDCSQCHATDRWTISEYQHPLARSDDCSQCHEAPPSHYMGHFKMISARVADKPHARVEQCGKCHQTNSWNDIKRVGWYDHH